MFSWYLVVFACIGLVALFMKDISSDSARIRRCPNYGKRTLCKRKPEDKKSPSDSNWICSRCGNDIDEFGNTL